MQHVTVIGRGAVGTTLASALGAAGVAVTQRSGRDLDLAGLSGVLVLAIPDASLQDMSARLASVPSPLVLLHVAGARSKEELAAARAGGHAVGAMHPLVSFADRTRPPSLVGTTLVIAGDERAVTAAREIAEHVGAHPLVADVHGPAYHAAAAMMANGAAALAHASADLLVALGCDRKQAETALAAMLVSVASNVASVGVPAALTGPVRRGDVQTVRAHREAVRAADPSLLPAYDAISRIIVRCARDAGLESKSAEQLLDALFDEPR